MAGPRIEAQGTKRWTRREVFTIGGFGKGRGIFPRFQENTNVAWGPLLEKIRSKRAQKDKKENAEVGHGKKMNEVRIGGGEKN